MTHIHAWWIGASATIVSAGLITLTTSNLITSLLGLVPGVIALVGTIFGAKAVVTNGTPQVTPVADPRDNQGRALVPAPPVPPVDPIVAPPL